MVMEILQLLKSDETHLKRLKRLEIPVFPAGEGWGHQKRGSEGSYFHGNFQQLKTSKGVIFPKEFLEMHADPNLGQIG